MSRGALSAQPESRLARARRSLDGLSVGDALGESFVLPSAEVRTRLVTRELPEGPLQHTDDTQMGMALWEVLATRQSVDPLLFAERLAQRYRAAPWRGYGGFAQRLLAALWSSAVAWEELARSAFGGQGSWGNGAAMRAGPLGAYFADDVGAGVDAARLQARVTHAHPEGIDGAVAVAVAAAEAARRGPSSRPESSPLLLEAASASVGEGEVKRRLREAIGLPFTTSPRDAAAALGSGEEVRASDTVPFALWCASRHLGDFTETFWSTVSGLGDRDTTCAIACSVAVLACAEGAIPPEWLARREPLDLRSLQAPGMLLRETGSLV